MTLNIIESHFPPCLHDSRVTQTTGENDGLFGQYVFNPGTSLQPKRASFDKRVKISKLRGQKKKIRLAILPMQHPAFLCVFNIRNK
jgi:hypothetical protein